MLINGLKDSKVVATYGEFDPVTTKPGLDLPPGDWYDLKGSGPGGREFWFKIVVVLDDPGAWWVCDVTITGAE